MKFEMILDRTRALLERRRRQEKLEQDLNQFWDLEGVPAFEALGITDDDLLKFADGHMGNGFLERMLEANGINVTQLKDCLPTLFEELEHRCSQCKDWRRCKRDMDASKSFENAPSYCANHSQIDALRA